MQKRIIAETALQRAVVQGVTALRLKMAGQRQVSFLEITLNTAEFAELMGVSERHVRRLAQTQKYPHTVELNKRNRPEYIFHLSDLPADIQRRWYERNGERAEVTELLEEAKQKIGKKPASRKELDHYTAAEREQIAFWMDVVDEWRAYRSGDGRAAELDEDFIERLRARYPDKQISKPTLYRKWQAVRRDDWDSLIENRGKGRKGYSSIHPEAWEIFSALYLEETKLGIERCMELTEEWARINCPEALPLPSPPTFQRAIQKIPPDVRYYARAGKQKWWAKYSPYITRKYDEMVSNEVWVGDTYTMDIVTMAETGQLHRMYLSAWVDARSGIFVGWSISGESKSQNSVNALRDACIRQGTLPLLNLYTDNGREYLTFDFGGRGHRAKAILANGEAPFQPLTIMQRMEVKMINAIPKNSRAKVVERSFRALKDRVMRLFPTFTGGSPAEKPEQLKGILKDGKSVPTDEQARDILDKLIQYDLNYSKYNGSVVKDQGKRKIDVYNEYCVEEKVAASEEVLRLMLMRSTRPITVKRDGIVTSINGVPMKFWCEEIRHYIERKVYIRYDPADLSSVRMYDADKDNYLMTVGRSPLEASYHEDPKVLAALMKAERRVERAVREDVKTRRERGKDVNPVEYALNLAARNAAGSVAKKNIKRTRILYDQETGRAPQLPMAVGDSDDLDIALMNRNRMKRMKGAIDDGEDI